ncbi:TTC8 [Bugula neritina]|uniref:TTC8 n=1 Tax=Bugula neritina TaxID=10212 RepID=A0A7J7JS62_BUGNE|nr:TTC8 [Bugula neritina]
MDPLFLAYSLFRRRRLQECVDICSELLSKNPLDQAVWSLKMRALTEQVYVDEIENDEEGIAELLMDDNAIANVARPGTSLKKPPTAVSGGPTAAMRPTSQSGRPMSGFARPGTQGGRPGTMEQAIKTPRTSHTARPITSASGRYVRSGTASMLSTPDGPFINISRLNLNKYAQKNALARSLFEFIFHHENDVRHALELAAYATEANQYKDWWWKIQLAKCYVRLGMFRDAEKQVLSALKQQDMIDCYLLLAKCSVKLDQPLTAVETYKKGLEKFPQDTSLLTGIARIYELLNNITESSVFYKQVLSTDNMNIEAIACIGSNYFYSDQPEIALKFYRRLLQMGVNNAELLNNLALSCFYAQQYDMTLTCFERALALSDNETAADIWYNVGHVALGVGDTSLAYQCFRMALSVDNNHAEAYNNLGVLELRRGRIEQARAFFQASFSLAPQMYEPHYNSGMMSEWIGDVQSAFLSVKRSLEAFEI